MKKLNILHLMSARQYVGEAARVVDLAQSQIEKGHSVTLVVKSKQTVAAEAGRRGIPYVEATMGSKFHPIDDYKDVRLIQRLIRDKDIDIVHAHRGKDHWLGSCALWRSRKRIPMVRTRHVVTKIKDHAANRLLFSRYTQGLISVSNAVANAVDECLTYYKGLRKTIPGGIRTRPLAIDYTAQAEDFRKRLHIQENSKVLLVLGRLCGIKGQRHVVNAMPEILDKFPDTILLMAYPRESKYRDEIEEGINSLGVKKSVRWLGKVDSVFPLLELADIGVIASIGSEGWSRVAVESMHMGLPLVSTTVGSLPEIVRDGESGILIPPGDAEAIAEAVNRLLADEELCRKFGAAAKGFAAPYTYDRMADEVLALYEELLA